MAAQYYSCSLGVPWFHLTVETCTPNTKQIGVCLGVPQVGTILLKFAKLWLFLSRLPLQLMRNLVVNYFRKPDQRMIFRCHPHPQNRHLKHRKKTSVKVITPEVAAAMVTDRGATFVTAAIAQSLGHNLDDIALSHSTVRRSRCNNREISNLI